MTAMRCPDCGADLDDVPIGDPSSHNAENNWRIGPANSIPPVDAKRSARTSQDDVRAEHAAHRPSSSTV
jgi:hypothetical protein